LKGSEKKKQTVTQTWRSQVRCTGQGRIPTIKHVENTPVRFMTDVEKSKRDVKRLLEPSVNDPVMGDL
jgi:hypothetical protein